MNNNLDKQYTDLLQDILDNGVTKSDRTGTGTISVFGRQIRHKMSEGFPLLTSKKMPFKTITTELLWFLRGDTNIKYLVDNNCHIWDGDAYQRYKTTYDIESREGSYGLEELHMLSDLTKEEFTNKIKTDDGFANKWGELGPIYGKQWRKWKRYRKVEDIEHKETLHIIDYIDQIANSINLLKTDPDSRRNRVNAWNVGELDQMVLPPCHTDFQFYTRELSAQERLEWVKVNLPNIDVNGFVNNDEYSHKWVETLSNNIPKRAISLMYNARSQDVPLGTPFNIASYGLLLEIIAKMVNMIPDELITNMGDCHIYLNQIDGVKEQIGRDYTLEERLNMVSEEIQKEFSSGIVNLPNFPNTPVWSDGGKMSCLDDFGVPRRTREPYPLPKLKLLKTDAFWKGFDVSLFGHLEPSDFQIEGYKSHSPIKMPLSN
jgi:thymidylate synthase